jgi:chromosome segregation ATPase
LLNAKQHLDGHVILPLEQLYQRIRFNEQIIRDVYEGQVALLTAGAVSEKREEKGRVERKGEPHEAEAETAEEVNGIENKIRIIQSNQKKLKERIENVGKKLIQQKNLSASALSTSQATRSKISYAERSYYAQLQSWEEMCEKMEKLMTNLTMTKEYLQAERYPYPSHAAANVSSSGVILLSPQEEEICQNLLGSQVIPLPPPSLVSDRTDP